MTRSSVWTPRRTKQLWPPPEDDRAAIAREAVALSDTGMQNALNVPRVGSKWSFRPDISGSQYMPPPPPPPPSSKRKELVKEVPKYTADELRAVAAELQLEAAELVQDVRPVSLQVQLGSSLLDGNYTIAKLLKDWDAKGKGELLKGCISETITITPSSSPSPSPSNYHDDLLHHPRLHLHLLTSTQSLSSSTSTPPTYAPSPSPSPTPARPPRCSHSQTHTWSR